MAGSLLINAELNHSNIYYYTYLHVWKYLLTQVGVPAYTVGGICLHGSDYLLSRWEYLLIQMGVPSYTCGIACLYVWEYLRI